MQIAFDPGALQVVEVQEGAFFRQAGAKTSFAHNVDQKSGRVFIGTGRVAPEGVKGAETVVSILFRAKAPNPKSEFRVIAATPTASGPGAITVALPPPQVLNITQ
jgi:general secretion pathway protein D